VRLVGFIIRIHVSSFLRSFSGCLFLHQRTRYRLSQSGRSGMGGFSIDSCRKICGVVDDRKNLPNRSMTVKIISFDFVPTVKENERAKTKFSKENIMGP